MGNTNMRLAGAELDYTDYYVFDGTFSNDQYELPGTGAQLGNRFLVSPGTTPDPRGVVDPELDPLFQDELILEIGRAHSELQSLMRISYAVFCLTNNK